MVKRRQKQYPDRPWEPNPQELEIYADVCRGDLLQRQIAERHGVSQSYVFNLAKRVDQWLAPQLMDSIREIKAQHTQRLMHIYTEAMLAWEKSKRPAVKVATKAHKYGMERRLTKEFQCGDAGFLAQARSALQEIREIWGANAPVHVLHGGEIRVAGKTVEEARTEAWKRIERLMEAASN